MNEQSLSISLPIAGTPASVPDRRVTLETEPAAGTAEASLADIDAMRVRARSGLSARTLQEERCECAKIMPDGTLVLHLAVLVWPSHPDLAYRLILPDIASAQTVEIYTRVQRWLYWTGGANSLALPWRLEYPQIKWMPGLPVVDEFSSPLPTLPAIHHEHADITLDSPDAAPYGVLAVRGAAVGYRHPFILEFAKFDEETGEAVRIELDDLPVEAQWYDARGELQSAGVTVPIPDCAKALLETCDDGQAVFRFSSQHDKDGWEIAYSVCDGSVLGRRRRNGQ